jgi:hypothetical protein
MTLEYWKEYPTMLNLGIKYGIKKSTVCKTIKKIEDILIKSGKFRLPGKNELLKPELKNETLILDATEISIEKPLKK